MRYLRPSSLAAVLLCACGQPADDVHFVAVNAVIPDLREVAIDEFENSGIDYRITETGILEADYARVEDISEIVIRIWETYLPKNRSFSINPAYLAAFRGQLDDASIPYRSIRADGLLWTVVEERDVARAREIQDQVFGMGTEPYLRDDNSPGQENHQ